MIRYLPVVLLVSALPVRAAGSKDTHVIKPGQILGRSERTVAESLNLPGDVTGEKIDAPTEPAPTIDDQDFTEVFDLQKRLLATSSAGNPASSNPEIASTRALHDALRANAHGAGQDLRPAAWSRRPADVNFDGRGELPRGEPTVSAALEIPGFSDVIGRVRREGAAKDYKLAKGVQVHERTLNEEGHQLLVQDIDGWWPQEFFMTRVFFFRKDAVGKTLVAVKTDGDGVLTDGRGEDYQAELRWWRQRMRKPASHRGS